MTIQMRVFDGIKIRTQTFREVYRGVNLAQHREGFFAQEAYSKWGVMVQLKGKERIVLGRFGTEDPEENQGAVLAGVKA